MSVCSLNARIAHSETCMLSHCGPGNTSPDQLVKAGQVKELKSLRINLKKWLEPGTGRSLLHLAAASNQVEVISYLVKEAKLDTNVQDEDGNTPLHLSVVNGHTEATNAILSHGADDSICNKKGEPALHLAIKLGSQGIKVLSDFVKHPKVNLLVRGFHNSTAFHIIAMTNNVKALNLLYSRLREIPIVSWKNSIGMTVFHLAALSGSCDVLEFLLSHASNVEGNLVNLSTERRSPLHYAVEHRHMNCIRVLLKHGSDPTHQSGYLPPPLHLACWQGDLETVQLMVDTCGQHAHLTVTRPQWGGLLFTAAPPLRAVRS